MRHIYSILLPGESHPDPNRVHSSAAVHEARWDEAGAGIVPPGEAEIALGVAIVTLKRCPP